MEISNIRALSRRCCTAWSYMAYVQFHESHLRLDSGCLPTGCQTRPLAKDYNAAATALVFRLVTGE